MEAWTGSPLRLTVYFQARTLAAFAIGTIALVTARSLIAANGHASLSASRARTRFQSGGFSN